MVLVPWWTVTACSGGDPPSVLEPASEAAEQVAGLWWVLFWIGVAAVAVVTAFLVVAIRRRRAELDDGIDRRSVPWGDRFVVIAGIVVPGVILAGTFVFSLGVLNSLAGPSDDGGRRSPDTPLTVRVVSHNWWWEVRYPNGAVTANEIPIPVGEPVELVLPTADVIHSFWVPELQVKKDHIPGSDNRLLLRAKRAGRFAGQCAEFCGLQHAQMRFHVEALPTAAFDAWLTREARTARQPDGRAARRGSELFANSSCAGCHTIRGTRADGELGPDLTHVASRQTIGAGLLPLTRANLTDFIADPQDDKPGVSMPPTELTPEEVAAVADYLLELE